MFNGRACGAEVGGDAAELEPLRAQDQQPLDRAGGPGKRGHQRASNTTRLRSHDRTRVHIRAPRKIRAFGLRGAMFGREALFEGFEGSPFQESRPGGPGKGGPSAAMGARVVEMRPLSRYASVAVRSRKANRLMLYRRFIRPIFALARTRPIVRTILPPMLVC